MTDDVTRQPEGVYRTLGPGSRIAGYLIGEQIGAGGMAVVFRARDEVLGRLAAVKVIAPSMANDQEFRARFLRESRMVAAVDSLHIIPVYAAGEAEGLLYIATRFVAGGDLAKLVRLAGGRLSADRAVALISQVASALDAAHAAGLVHRDVKPQNILVDAVPERPEHAFLSDFGLSKGTQSATRLTAEGQFLGTPDYSAPEQIRGGQVDGRTDQYALACVAYVLLTGELPFPRSDTVATMFAHLQEAVPLVTRLRPELSPTVNDVIARALAKLPADRYRRCSDFAAALQEAVALGGRASEPDPWAWLARDDRAAARVPAPGHGQWQLPSAPGRPGSPPSPAFTPPPTYTPSAPRATREPARVPRTAAPEPVPVPAEYAAAFATAIKENAGYADTVSSGNGGAGRAARLAAGGARGRLASRRFQMALIGGATALVLAAVGGIYAVSQTGSSSSTSLAGQLSPVSRPTQVATLTVPGGNAIDTVWTSADGRLIAASGQGRSIYVFDAAKHSYDMTISAPNIRIGSNVYSPVIDNLAFSADDSSLTAVVYPDVPSGAPTPGSFSAYAVYQWSLQSGSQPTSLWSEQVPTTVAFSNDMNTALTSQNNVVSRLTLSPQLSTAPAVTLPGGADLGYTPPYELDLTGDRVIYHPVSDWTYVWDFNQENVVAKLHSPEYTVLSTDGKTMLMANPTNYPDGSTAPPALWDVATKADITPSDPRWKAQLREPWEVYSWETYSLDGSIILTRRTGGQYDLWSTATHKYLLTITAPDYRQNGFATAADHGREVVILTTPKKVNGQDEYRQIDLWETPLH